MRRSLAKFGEILAKGGGKFGNVSLPEHAGLMTLPWWIPSRRCFGCFSMLTFRVLVKRFRGLPYTA
jgi:hypothetical protein